eukprot:403360359
MDNCNQPQASTIDQLEQIDKKLIIQSNKNTATGQDNIKTFNKHILQYQCDRQVDKELYAKAHHKIQTIENLGQQLNIRMDINDRNITVINNNITVINDNITVINDNITTLQDDVKMFKMNTQRDLQFIKNTLVHFGDYFKISPIAETQNLEQIQARGNPHPNSTSDVDGKEEQKEKEGQKMYHSTISIDPDFAPGAPLIDQEPKQKQENQDKEAE